MTKQAAKQADRRLSNEGIGVWDSFVHWVPQQGGAHAAILVAMGWPTARSRSRIKRRLCHTRFQLSPQSALHWGYIPAALRHGTFPPPLLALLQAFGNGALPGSHPLGAAVACYGHAHVNTLDQDLGIQHAACKATGCGVVRADKASGSRRDGRTEVPVLLDFVRLGDTLIVTHIDRLVRLMNALWNIVHA